MSQSQQKSVDISGIDWMISYIRWKSRHLPAGGNNFSILADVSETFCFEQVQNKMDRLDNIKAFLSGEIKRDLRGWRPRWHYGKGKGAGILCSAEPEAQDITITNKLPRGVALKIVYFVPKRQILFTFSHAVFDGVGAERFITFLLKPEFADEVPDRQIPIDIPAMKQNGRELQAVMKGFPEKKILRLPGAGNNMGENKFNTICFLPEHYHALEKAVEDKYGPFSFSLFILALILCHAEKYLFPAAPEKEYIMIPMSVDQRNPGSEDGDMFFNHWSLMPLLISRKILKEGIPETVRHLRILYTKALAARIPQLFYNASEAMKYVPYLGIDMFVRFTPAKTLGTMMFSFLNSTGAGAGMLHNLAHYPNMPYGSDLGFFVNICNDNLNIIISRRPGKKEEAFALFFRELEKQLQSIKV